MSEWTAYFATALLLILVPFSVVALTKATLPNNESSGALRERLALAEGGLGMVMMLLMLALLYSCTIGAPKSGQVSCVDKWKAWFREAGSPLTLSDGRNATDVAFERCARGVEPF